MPSGCRPGVVWEPTASDAFILFSLLMLLFEFIKATRHGKSFVEHFLSLLLAGGAGAEFAMVNPNAIMNQLSAPAQMGNSTFMLFVAICFVDLFAGFAAALRRARRAVVVEQAPVVVAPACRWFAPSPHASSRSRACRAGAGQSVHPYRVAATAGIAGRPEPVVKIEPVQKIEP